jgi:hypothetical protein
MSQFNNSVISSWHEQSELPSYWRDTETQEHFPDQLPLSNLRYPDYASMTLPGVMNSENIVVAKEVDGETFTIKNWCRVGVLDYKCWVAFDVEGSPLVFFDKKAPLNPIPDARTPEQLANPLLEFAD